MPKKHYDDEDSQIHLPGVHYDPFDATPSHFHCDARILPSVISSPFSPIVYNLIRDTADVLDNNKEYEE